ncbi:hypothetical protein VPNG_00758 [Cytospora leucostoma]|uniref:Major facilitator superfamily (MFS) profile domain-containing protein n=1 Tax=Cytospora leucostoma TaxID=1230097 RepID=A0A423XLY3_9PEZI|nr:hypothetical protein VPNG_00758 [Cytospora leucostoma]
MSTAGFEQQLPSFKEDSIAVEAVPEPTDVSPNSKEGDDHNAELLQEHGISTLTKYDPSNSFSRFQSLRDRPDDPEDPHNWPSSRKILISVIVSFGQLVTLMSTSMMASALSQIGHDLGRDDSITQITFSIFILGLAFAPLPIAALSEMFGRKPVGWSAMPAGSGASVGITLTGPVMADMYRKEHRGKSLAIATFVPYLGPALGPVVGGLITQKLAWPWLFWVLSMFDAVITLVGLFFLKETYTPVLLRRKTAARNDPHHELSQPPLSMVSRRDVYHRLFANLARPMRLLVHRPIMQVIALIIALNFGIYSLLLSTFASLWIDRYHQSEFTSSLHYIAISVGTTIATQAGGPSMDYIFRRLKARSRDGSTTPEFRVPYLVPGVVLVPAGLFWYGWAAETGMHWAMVDAGVVVSVCGNFILSQGMLAYLLDEFHHAASANAASRMLSNILGFAFPIFAPRMYSRLGYGWGNSMLAFIFIALGWPAPLILWRWGAKLRSLGREK